MIDLLSIFFLTYEVNAINFLPGIPHILISCFFFQFKISLISIEISCLTHVLFKNVLVNLQVFGNFPVIFLLLVSPLIPLCSENTFCVISVLLGLWWFISWPRLWSVLVNVLWTLENNMYFVVVRRSILQMLSRSYLLLVSLSSSISLLILLSTCCISC